MAGAGAARSSSRRLCRRSQPHRTSAAAAAAAALAAVAAALLLVAGTWGVPAADAAADGLATHGSRVLLQQQDQSPAQDQQPLGVQLVGAGGGAGSSAVPPNGGDTAAGGSTGGGGGGSTSSIDTLPNSGGAGSGTVNLAGSTSLGTESTGTAGGNATGLFDGGGGTAAAGGEPRTEGSDSPLDLSPADAPANSQTVTASGGPPSGGGGDVAAPGPASAPGVGTADLDTLEVVAPNITTTAPSVVPYNANGTYDGSGGAAAAGGEPRTEGTDSSVDTPPVDASLAGPGAGTVVDSPLGGDTAAVPAPALGGDVSGGAGAANTTAAPAVDAAGGDFDSGTDTTTATPNLNATTAVAPTPDATFSAMVPDATVGPTTGAGGTTDMTGAAAADNSSALVTAASGPEEAEESDEESDRSSDSDTHSSSSSNSSSSRGGSSGGGSRDGGERGLGVDAGECDWRRAHLDCAAGFSCIPSSTSGDAPGTCTANPLGGNPLPPDLAVPVVFYPLTNGSLDAWPPGSGAAYDGYVVQGDPYWTEIEEADPDDPFPGALTCDMESNSLIGFPGLPYGRTGAFTINFWMRKRPEDTPDASDNAEDDNDNGGVGGPYEYMLSHVNLQPLSPQAKRYSPFDRNQITVYLPSRRSPLYGIARGIVKDSNDGPSQLYLDSDGMVADNERRQPIYSATNLTDGQWHMITISSQPAGGRGWRMYLDGMLAVQIPNPDYPGPSTSTSAEIDGGDPLFLGGPLLLCGRYGGAASRAYGGQLANLAVFDTALAARQVELLYNMVIDPNAVPKPTIPFRRHPWYGSTLLTPPEWLSADDSNAKLAAEASGRLGTALSLTRPAPAPADGGGGSGNGTALNATERAEMAAAAEELAEALTMLLAGVSYNRTAGMPCSLDLRREGGLSYCQSGLVCAPVHLPSNTTAVYDSATPTTGGADTPTPDGVTAAAVSAAVDAVRSASQLLGVCALPAPAMLLPASWPADWPAPIAHFPLTRGSLRSWPVNAYGGRLVNATWQPDTRFGDVLRCDKDRRSLVVLDAVPYGSRGPMAINLWVRTSRRDLTSAPGGSVGPAFQYVFSHMAAGPFSSFGPNQVHLYIPEVGSPLYGISVRAILRDGDDVYVGRESEVWLDSDGSVGNDLPRRWAPRDDGVNIADGGWHMITLSTHWSGPGYALYIDGVLRGDLRPGAVRSTRNQSDTTVEVPGGFPAQLTGPIVLCGRSDSDPDRFFSGGVAALSVWDAALAPWQVASLYGVYQRQAVMMPAGQIVQGGGYISAVAATGDPCVFPLSYGGRTMYGCITLNGVLSCPIQGGGWSPCNISADQPALAVGGGGNDTATSGSGGDSGGNRTDGRGGSGGPNRIGLAIIGGDGGDGGGDGDGDDDVFNLVPYGIADGSMVGPAGGGMPRLTVGGQLCVLPFTMGDITYFDCALIEGVELCPTLNPDGTPSSGGTSSSARAGGAASAAPGTADDEDDDDQDYPPVLMECAPVVIRPLYRTTCRSAGVEVGGGASPSSSSTGPAPPGRKNFTQCVSLMGVDACQTQEGLWLVCPPPPRTTVTGRTCQVPFGYGPLVRSDCVLPANATTPTTPTTPTNTDAAGTTTDSSTSGSSSGKGGSYRRGDSSSGSDAAAVLSGSRGGVGEVCVVEDGLLQRCQPTYVPPPTLQPRYPIRYTIDRQRCLPPGPGALSECLDYSAVAEVEETPPDTSLDSAGLGGRFSCQVESGALLECAPVERVTLTGAGPDGSDPGDCAFPFPFQGRNRTDCVWLGGVEACKLADGSWAECSPMFVTTFPAPPPNVTVSSRHTVNGQQCAIPFFFGGSLRWDCVGGDLDPGFCRSRNGSWEQCMPRAQSGRPRTTITGQLCQLPFFPPPGDPYAPPTTSGSSSPGDTAALPAFDCVGPPPGRCLNPQGRMEPCAPRPRMATSGVACSLPFTFKNTTHYDCFTPPADIAAAALANANANAVPGSGSAPGSGSDATTGPGSASTLEFCSAVPVAYDASDLLPCVPLEADVADDTMQPAAGAGGQRQGPTAAGAGGSGKRGRTAVGDGPAAAITRGGDDEGMESAEVDPSAALESRADGEEEGGAARAKEAALRRRNLGLGLGLGVGLPGLIVLVAGLAALRRRWARQHVRRVMREMRLDPDTGAPLGSSGTPGAPGPIAAAAGRAYGSSTTTTPGGGLGVRLGGYAGPTSKTILPPHPHTRHDATAEVEMSPSPSPSPSPASSPGLYGTSPTGRGGPTAAAAPKTSPSPSPAGPTTTCPPLPQSTTGGLPARSFSSAGNGQQQLQPQQSGGSGAGPLPLQLTGSSDMGAGGFRPPRPAPPPPFARSGGVNAFTTGQLSPAASLGGSAGGRGGGGGVGVPPV